MKKIIIMLALLVGFNVNAGLIEIELSENNVKVGERIEVRLAASDFEDFDAFGFNLKFDTSVFNFDRATLNSDLFASLTVFGFFDGIQQSNGAGFSFSDFSPISAGDFLLASFDLVAVGEGSTGVSLAGVEFFEPFPSSTQLSVDSNATATATVPEPSTFVLLLLAGMFIFTRVAKANSHSENNKNTVVFKL
jgi:hypothetical protein